MITLSFRHSGMVAVAASVLIAIECGVAAGQQFMPPEEAATAIADGRPWNAEPVDGPGAKLTLNQDGSGTFDGPMTLSIAWEIRGEEICLILGFPGTKCLRFQPVQNGFEGYAEGKRDLLLSR